MLIGEKAIGLRFFRVLLPGFSSKMLIPNVFVEYMSNQKKGKENATLVSSNGKIWHADFYMDKENLCFGGEGWKRFAMANELKVGYFLIFRYKGHMVFTYKVFDLSTCERNYGPAPQFRRNNTHCVDDEEEEEDASLTQEPLKQPSKETRKAISKVKRCNKSKGQFEIIINRRRYPPLIPAEFRESCGLAMKDEYVQLRDPMDRIWLVQVCVRRRLKGLYMIKGFQLFVSANKLRAGDRCIFELVSQEETKVFQVKIG